MSHCRSLQMYRKTWLFVALVTVCFITRAHASCVDRNSCGNGGSCLSGQCVCTSGWAGSNCNTRCNKVCNNGGTCVIVGQNHVRRCQCAIGYSGPNCNRGCNIRCQNGGTCRINEEDQKSCECATGFSGELCETRLNPCASNPCQNGGICGGDPTFYTCTCINGYSGPNCNTGPCDTSPCENGGTCIAVHTNSPGYDCNCPFGYTGKNCDTVTNRCDETRCHPNATCNQSTNYTCVCDDGFVGNGSSCEDRCEKARCHLNATCNQTANYTCVCHDGFVGNGSSCQDRCEIARCHPSATCNQTTNYTCVCGDGFNGNGSHCEDLCEKANCHHNATCNQTTNYTCVCGNGFNGNGSHCEDLCEKANCHHNATCNQTTNYTCVCDDAFIGNGSSCEDRCKKARCHVRATCNKSTNYTCICDDGFEGNGSSCQSICELANCHPNATCSTSNNVAYCTCGSGFSGDGKNCTAFHDWGDWTSCSESCGNGSTQRTRLCIAPGSLSCVGETTEEKSCAMPPCPVNGDWSQWEPWSSCSATCGSGAKTRTRTCTNPRPAHGGNKCVGVSEEIGDCVHETECAGAAGFGEWTMWTSCSRTCGYGIQNRTRTCEEKALECTAETSQGKFCLLGNCPVNGNYTEWGNWSDCSKSCGPGKQFRHRNCTNPEPAHGGVECQGPAEEAKECTLELLCEGDYGYRDWSVWSSCTRSCGSGLQWRARECDFTDPGNSFCRGQANETTSCNTRPCPVHGGFSDWTNWSPCSVSCDSGVEERTRSCTNPTPKHGGNECSGSIRSIKYCENPICPGSENYSLWSSWSSCSVSCSSGTQTKTRQCLNSKQLGCNGPVSMVRECLFPDCPVHGGFTEWGSWSACLVTCGSRTIQRTRKCISPKPANNGSDCLGLAVQTSECTMPNVCPDQVGFTSWTQWSECGVTCSFGASYRTRNCTDETLETCNGTYEQNKTCYTVPCPINGQYSDWTLWSSCSGYCGSGLKNRIRTCSDPEPAYGGSGCSGADKEVKDCQHSVTCSGESGYTEWSSWTLCTQTCGNSTQIRTRKCKDLAPPEECSTTSIQRKPCDFGKCPVHGGWSDWSSWGSCSASCGSGRKLRERTCTNPVASYGGLPCYGNSHEYENCVMPESCPGEEEFSPWGDWDVCNADCGPGTRKRSRYCTVVPTYPPPEDPYCTLPTNQYMECYEEPCVVDGNFTKWTSWSACSTTCGFGTRKRYRNCTNPPPLFGGSDCIGQSHEVMECENPPACPGDASFSSWSFWDPCSSECEGLTRKTRDCLVSETECVSLTNVTMECNTQSCPVNGSWSTWTPWSSCSKTCGHQEEVRTRVCDNPRERNGGAHCPGHSIEVMPCSYYDYVPCPDPPAAQWSDWSWWTICNKSCAGGRQKRHRLCNNPPPAPGAKTCIGEAIQIKDCNVHRCPIPGNFTAWSEWTECSSECGNGTQIRTRTCTNPSPKFEGDDCDGDRNQLRHCNSHPCPIDGGFTEWTEWTFCDKPCNTGYSRRKRSCTNPEPMYGGRNCNGSNLDAKTCNTAACPPVNLRLNVTFKRFTWENNLAGQNEFKRNVERLVCIKVNKKREQGLSQSFQTISPLTMRKPSVLGGRFTFRNDRNQNVECVLTLYFNSVAQDELVVLQDKFLDEDSETSLHNISSQNIFSSPLNAGVRAVSSTSIEVEWTALEQSAQTSQTSTVGGYVIFYRDKSSSNYHQVAVQHDVLTTALEDLQKFTHYQVVVSPYSENGNGVPSHPIANETYEDVPSFPPVITEFHSPNSTTLNVSWTGIQERHLHGIPRGYCVYYRESSSRTTEIQHVPSISQLNTTIVGLKSYTRYYLQVAAKTTPGCGAKSDAKLAVTQEDVPGEPPQDVTVRNLTATGILVEWKNVRTSEQNGIIRGYKVFYTKSGVTNAVDVNDGDAKNLEIMGLDIYTEYSIKLLAYTSVGDGPESNALAVSTDESTPSEAPVIIRALNTSSSSIELQWNAISPDNCHGNLLGYRIYYRPANTKRRAKVIDHRSNILRIELTDLFLWWWYELRIGGYTRVGTGFTINVTVQTDEEIPSRFPENIRGVAQSPTSISFEWDPVLPGFVHGILLGYNLTARQTEDFSNVVVQTILPPYERSYYAEGLKKYTNYTIWVRAINSKGHGAVYGPGHINSTGEDGPEVPPSDIRVSTLTDISSINIEWTRIPSEFHNGILRGYYIDYTAVVLAGQVVPKGDRVVNSVRIRGNRYATVLRNLQPGSKYEIQIYGYTIKNGTKSNATAAETCRCPRYIRANWWVLPPYTNTIDSSRPGGIFFMITNRVLDSVCGMCENGHGRTTFCYTEGCDKRRRRRSTTNKFQKNSLQDLVTNINEEFEVSFPVQGNRYMTTYAGVFPYISVVDAPGSAYFTVKNVPSTGEVVVNASLACIPMVILMSLFAWLAGIIIWVLERKENEEHFPAPFTRGVPEGFWWAFISMTTVGYGDRSPITVSGRLFAIVWILMGLVIISIVTGGIVTSITSVLVVQEDKIYGAQVAAITNSSEYRKAVRQNADVVGYKNMEEVIKAMKNKEVTGALIDIYAAATKKDLFQGGDIQLNRMIEYPTGYGIVLSGNMAKAAPLFQDALTAQKGEISRIIEENTDTISQDRNEAEEAKEKTSGLFDPSTDAFKNSFNVTIGLLAAVIAAGLIWHFMVYRKRENVKKILEEETRNKSPGLRVMEYLKSDGVEKLKDFTQTLKTQILTLRKRHIRERKNTMFYMAENQERKKIARNSVPIRRSTARVSSELNAGMDPVECEVSLCGKPVSQPSHAVFYESEKQGSAWIDLTKEGKNFRESSVTVLEDLET